MKVWDICQLCSLFYWRIACGAFQSICPSGVLLPTCFPLEQGNGLLRILCSMPQPSPDPNAVWHDTMRLEGWGQGSGLQLARGACPVRGGDLDQCTLSSEDMAHLVSEYPWQLSQIIYSCFPQTLSWRKCFLYLWDTQQVAGNGLWAMGVRVSRYLCKNTGNTPPGSMRIFLCGHVCTPKQTGTGLLRALHVTGRSKVLQGGGSLFASREPLQVVE